ncbi:MAG: Gfo/Idh/MocA family oxidoreductase [Planctomycetota bacterium]
MTDGNKNSTSRRQFIKSTSTLAAAGAALGSSALTSPASGFHHSVRDTLHVGVVGCGGRGTHAATNALNGDENCKITALADIFPNRLEECVRSLNQQVPDRMELEGRTFSGWDCCEELLKTNVDVVILTTPPHFRPAQLKMCIDAGKHVFCEKPVGVDVPGVLDVMETCRQAQEKGLSVVSGLCWRYDYGVREVMKRIQDGAIGEIKAIQENYLTGLLWHRGNNPEWSQMETQMRNWLYYTWLSGDHIAEQHIHSIDKALWLMNDEPPKTCYGTGGRLVRTDPKFGNVYDHFSCVFEWENGTKCFSHCRQMDANFTNVEDYVFGSKGTAEVLKHAINDEIVYEKRGKPSMYDVEHEFLFKGIRDGNPINNGTYMSYSTLMAIMGREAAYTGKRLNWDEFLQDDLRLGPDTYEWGDYEPMPVALPESD